MSRRFLVLAAFFTLAFCWGCGGGGGASSGGGGTTQDLQVNATFAPSTREVPGYADTLVVTVVPPGGVSLPGTFANPFQLTRSSTSLPLTGLAVSAAPYTFQMQALTDGEVVGTAVRTIVIGSGTPPPLDVSANILSEVDFIAIEGLTTMNVGENLQLTAHAVNSQGQTLFSGAGFTWSSSDTGVLQVNSETGECTAVSDGSASVTATLTGTSESASVTVLVAVGETIAVFVLPTSGVLDPGAQLQFSAFTDQGQHDFVWSVEEANGGTVTQDGLYTAPMTPGTYYVRATSSADPQTFMSAMAVVGDVGEWSFVDLHPAGQPASMALGASNGLQVGKAFSVSRPSLWSGTSQSWVDLTPPGSSGPGTAWGIDDGRQVGEVGGHAHLWSGTAASAVDLHPFGSTLSVARCIDGEYQAGYAVIGGQTRAALWNNTAQSFVDLHPPGYDNSRVVSIKGTSQGGFTVSSTGKQSASLWSMTAQSHVDLDPGMEDSVVHGVNDGVQVGVVKLPSENSHASVWHGTAESWTDIHPKYCAHSYAYATTGGQHVGAASFGTVGNGYAGHAYYWNDDGSRLDLHWFLGSEYLSSQALGIWVEGDTTYIVGWAMHTATWKQHAVMWVRQN